MSGRAYGFDSRQPHHVGAKSALLRTKKERHDLGRVFLFLLSVAGVGLPFIWFEDPALGRDPFLSQLIWKIFEME